MSTFYQNYKTDKISTDQVVPISYSSDSRHIIFSIDADVSTTATFRIVGSVEETAPDFNSAASATNSWSYLAFRDLATGSLIAGATGVTFTTTTHHKMYEVESNGLAHLALELSTVSGDGVVSTFLLRND